MPESKLIQTNSLEKIKLNLSAIHTVSMSSIVTHNDNPILSAGLKFDPRPEVVMSSALHNKSQEHENLFHDHLENNQRISRVINQTSYS